MNFEEIRKEFFDLNENGIFRISKVKCWILKYSDLYKKTYNFVYNQHLFTNDDGLTVRLPPHGKPTAEEKLLDLYEALDTISGFYKNEKYFEQEMVCYHKIKDSYLDLKNWVTKNEYLGVDKYACFLIDYLDYNENDQEEYLKVYIDNSKKMKFILTDKILRKQLNFLKSLINFIGFKKFCPTG